MTSPAGAVRLIVGMWLLAVGIIVWDSYNNKHETFPPAYRFGGAAIVYSFLLAVASFPPAAGLAGMFSLAWTVGIVWRVNGATTGTAVPRTLAGPPKPKQTASGG